jgi:GDP-D-mannose dehydratase
LLNFLEIIRTEKKIIKLFNACSSECFGNIKNKPVTEKSRFNPQSPYAVAKLSAYFLIQNYRKIYNLHLTNGILFNHESSLRTEKFLSRRIISEIIAINKNKKLRMNINNIDDLKRDWGWAPEYVEAMYLINNDSIPNDYIIATGKSYTLRDFIKYTFKHFKLDYKKFVIEQKSNVNSINSLANPTKIYKNLKWKAKYDLKNIIKKMIDNEL